jgi:hypothetical protein
MLFLDNLLETIEKLFLFIEFKGYFGKGKYSRGAPMLNKTAEESKFGFESEDNDEEYSINFRNLIPMSAEK